MPSHEIRCQKDGLSCTLGSKGKGVGGRRVCCVGFPLLLWPGARWAVWEELGRRARLQAPVRWNYRCLCLTLTQPHGFGRPQQRQRRERVCSTSGKQRLLCGQRSNSRNKSRHQLMRLLHNTLHITRCQDGERAGYQYWPISSPKPDAFHKEILSVWTLGETGDGGRQFSSWCLQCGAVVAATGQSGYALPSHPVARYLPIPIQPSPHPSAPFAT